METYHGKLATVAEGRTPFYQNLGDVLGAELSELNNAGKWSSDCFVGPKDSNKMEALGKVT